MEIERKFLIKELPQNLERYDFHLIEQAYLCTEPVIRVRREDDNYYMTYKSKGLLAREEYNLPLTKEAYETLSVRTLLNRKRIINELSNANYMIRQQGERIALNTPIQGTSADIIKKAMVELHSKFKEYNIKTYDTSFAREKVLKKIIEESNSICFMTGAGISIASGIPDFRSTDGLYNQEWKYPPETIISHSFFYSNTKEFYRFYREKLIIKDVEPNITHIKLAQMEKAGKLSAVVTQNIDGLHQKAGSKRVYELHGSVLRNYCMKCGKFHSAEFVKNSVGLPRCGCGGMVKPDVVLYEEGLDQKTVEGSLRAIRDADMLIVAGTSLTVYPAAGSSNSAIQLTIPEDWTVELKSIGGGHSVDKRCYDDLNAMLRDCPLLLADGTPMAEHLLPWLRQYGSGTPEEEEKQV